jgi:hypothetical protein
MAAGSERIVPVPWLQRDDEYGDGGGGGGGGGMVEAMLDTEGRRLLAAAEAYFPPHVAVSRAWLASLVRLRRCAQCGDEYRELDNFRLSCRKGTHVLSVDRERSVGPDDPRAPWECCWQPDAWRTSGCVAADHTEDARMRRHRAESELYSAFPACLWFAVAHDNRSVLMDPAVAAPRDEDVRREYADDPDAGTPGSVATVVLLRYDWRQAKRRREDARARRDARLGIK